jgi:Ca2+-transporting ATPase
MLIKKMEACETMGTVSEICTGKTATLTKNDMNVKVMYTAGQFIQTNNRNKSVFLNSNLTEEAVTKIVDCIVYNCDSRVEMSDDAMYEACGNGTEVGMLRFLQQNDYEIQNLLTRKARECIVETNIPFGPIRKRQVVAIRQSKDHNIVKVIIKGAPEYIMPMCIRYMDMNGNSQVLDDYSRNEILNTELIQKCATQ